MTNEDLELNCKEDFKGLMVLMGAIVKQICLLPLEEYIQTTDRALDIGWVMDPTLWIQAQKIDPLRWN